MTLNTMNNKLKEMVEANKDKKQRAGFVCLGYGTNPSIVCRTEIPMEKLHCWEDGGKGGFYPSNYGNAPEALYYIKAEFYSEMTDGTVSAAEALKALEEGKLIAVDGVYQAYVEAGQKYTIETPVPDIKAGDIVKEEGSGGLFLVVKQYNEKGRFMVALVENYRILENIIYSQQRLNKEFTKVGTVSVKLIK